MAVVSGRSTVLAAFTTPQNEISLVAQTTENKNNTNNSQGLLTLDVLNETPIAIIVDSKLASVNNTTINTDAVTYLNLQFCDLKQLPQTLESLQNLRVLILSHNSLSQLPSCLETGLRKLEILDLSYNSIQQFEVEPKCHRILKSLIINDNNMANVPQWILKAKSFNLEKLIYNRNRITCLDCSVYDKSWNYRLKKLEMQNCTLLQRDLYFLKNIRTLEHLDISSDNEVFGSNSFVDLDQMFDNPSWLNRMQVLNLNGLSISILSNEVGLLKSLTELYLVKNELSWLPDTIKNLINLRILDVSFNSITHLPDMANLKELRKLKISHNKLTRVFDLSLLPKLQYFDAYDNEIDTVDGSLQYVESLDFEMNYFNTSNFEEEFDYHTKKEKLRNEHPSRNNGMKEQPKLVSDYDSSSSSEIYDSDSDIDAANNTEYKVNFDEDEECWDKVIVKDPNYVRLCTSSDDEWDGRVRKPIKKTRVIVRTPSYLFEDVD